MGECNTIPHRYTVISIAEGEDRNPPPHSLIECLIDSSQIFLRAVIFILKVMKNLRKNHANICDSR